MQEMQESEETSRSFIICQCVSQSITSGLGNLTTNGAIPAEFSSSPCSRHKPARWCSKDKPQLPRRIGWPQAPKERYAGCIPADEPLVLILIRTTFGLFKELLSATQ